MERIYREQPKNEDVRFVTIPEQHEGVEYRGFKGEMDALLVSKVVPEGYYCEPSKEEAPAVTEENL